MFTACRVGLTKSMRVASLPTVSSSVYLVSELCLIAISSREEDLAGQGLAPRLSEMLQVQQDAVSRAARRGTGYHGEVYVG